MAAASPDALLDAAGRGDRAALGRLLSLVERGGEPARRVGRLVHAAEPDHVVGITGAPGAGKSTLTDRLIAEARSAGRRVAVLAIDPTSPYSGGAILGDRVRMHGHSLDPEVFVRSMATRGHLGGLSLAVPESVRVLARSGYPLVLVETVGVGQVEVEVAGAADTVVVVLNPAWGDSVQAAKAGLLEIADIFALNKSDRPGAEETRRDLTTMLDMRPPGSDWRPPVVATEATTGKGTTELWDAIEAHRNWLERTGGLEQGRRDRRTSEFRAILLSALERRLLADERYESVVRGVLEGRLDPYEAADDWAGRDGAFGEAAPFNRNG